MEDISRRRRFEPDENEEKDLKRLRGVSGVDIGNKLVKMISKVDEAISGTIEETLSDLAKILYNHLEPYEGQIIEILAECAMYLPEKLTIFTTLIGLINSKSSEFGGNMVSKLVNCVNDCLGSENYDIVLRLTTFLADLGNAHVLTIKSILEFLQEFVDLAVQENVRSDYFVYIVLHSLPWIGAELSEKKSDELEILFSKIETYLQSRKKLHLKILQVWSSSEIHPQKDYLDSLWTQIQKLKKDKWMEHHIVRIYATFNSELSLAVAHNLPNVDPMLIVTNKNMPLPQVVFRLFDASDCPDDDQTLAPVNAIERFLIEEDLNWIIDNNYLDWRLCAKTLLKYHRREFVPLNYAIIEVIFGQLFCLPRSNHLEIFYGALLLELCRLEPNAIPQALAQAAELLYQRADTMQPICLDRFVNWFSYHLSNFQYRWSWMDWSYCLTYDTLHPKLIFVREVIEKCLRFSYYKKLTEFLPAEFEAIIPPEPEINDIFNEVTNEETFLMAKQFQSLIEAKKLDEVYELLKNESNEFNAEAVAIFTAVLLKLASKTFSHSFTALTKYHKIFRSVVQESEEMQSVILRTLYDCWNRNKQMLTILVDKMLKMQIVEPAIVQAWVFCDEMKREFKRQWVWDVLNTAINRLEVHYAKLLKNHQKLVRKVDKLKSTNGETKSEIVCKQRPKIIAPKVDKLEDLEAMEMEMDLNEALNSTSKDDLTEELEKKILKSSTNLEEIEENLKNVLLNICHKFTLILTEHLLNCETNKIDVETDFYNYVSGRFKHIFLAHSESMWKFVDDLDRKLFSSPTIEPRILDIFNQFRALKL